MGQFVHKGRKLLGLGLAGKNGNPSAVAHAQSRGDLLSKDKLDALRRDERNQAVTVLAYIPRHLPHLGKLCALGLRSIEDVDVAETNQNTGVLLGDVLLGVLVLLALDADDGGQNPNALLPLLHLPAELVPCVQASNPGGGRSLPCISRMFPKL